MRMAVLYDLLHDRARRGRRRRAAGGRLMLFCEDRRRGPLRRRSRPRPGAWSTPPSRAHRRAVRLRSSSGVVPAVEPVARRRGLVLAPAFVDPHVHLRTPGREDEETIASRHRGGCRRRLLRDPRDAEHRARRRLGGRARLARRAARAEQAEIPVGFLAAITKGSRGGADRDGRARRRRAPPASRTTAARSVAPGSCGARSSTRRSRAAARAPLRGADALARRADARGRGLGRARLRGLAPRSPRA